MKRFWPFLFLAVLAGCSAAPKRSALHYSPPSVAPVRGHISAALVHSTQVLKAATAAQSSLAHAHNLTSSLILHPSSLALADLQESLGEASGQVNSLLTENAGLQSALGEAQAQLTGLETKVGAQTDGLNTCGDEKNAALDQKHALEVKAAKEAKKYHRLKFAVCSLAAALACFVAVRLGLLKLLSFLGPYGMLGMAAIPVAVFTALWFIL